MIGILAYGSLIHADEHLSQDGLVSAIPVKVSGFKRLFEQRPSWREGEGDRVAVLNVQESSEDTINAICLCFKSEEREALRVRERGYIERRVSVEQLECYDDTVLPELDELYIYLGREEKRAHSILPNDTYLELCIKGANGWGNAFCLDFVSTTSLADGSALHEYIIRNKEELTQFYA